MRESEVNARHALFVALASACTGEPVAPPVLPAPEVTTAAVTPSPTSVLAALATAEVRHADSVAIRFGVVGEALDSMTPSIPASPGLLELPLLGLLAGTEYRLQVVAWGGGVMVAGDTLALVTGPLPADLPLFAAGGPAPSPGYVLFSTGTYGIVMNNAGRVVWYVHFEDGPSLNFQAQPNGRYVARPATADLAAVVPLVEMDALGRVTRSLGCAGGLRPRFHDVLVERNGGYWLLCDETREMDLTGIGGVAAAEVTGTVVQHLDPAGTLLFSWSAFDHLELTDLPLEDRAGAAVNWTHGNALDLDAEGNLYLSFRSLSEITKVDTRTGQVVWRLGGLRNAFTLPGGASPFLRQHGLRLTTGGELVLLDNFGESDGSRAERYRLDPGTGTATLTGTYSPEPATRAILGGTTQPLPGGGVLVAYGNGGRLEEYDAAGSRVWEVVGNAGYVFRAQRIRSLYHPEDGLAR